MSPKPDRDRDEEEIATRDVPAEAPLSKGKVDWVINYLGGEYLVATPNTHCHSSEVM